MAQIVYYLRDQFLVNFIGLFLIALMIKIKINKVGFGEILYFNASNRVRCTLLYNYAMI